MQKADGTVSRDDLMQHSRGNDFRFVAPAALEASGIEQALWLDGDTCIAEPKAVQEWLEHTRMIRAGKVRLSAAKEVERRFRSTHPPTNDRRV